ncbi:MAG: HNH endonuclease [Pseudobdellovibrionaceae bacterium]
MSNEIFGNVTKIFSNQHEVYNNESNVCSKETGNANNETHAKIEVSNLSDDALISAVRNLVKSERRIMHLVLLHIQEIDNRRLYLKLGYTSLYQYLTQELGYAENAAYDRMQGARLLKSNPNISKKIEEGALNLSQLVKVSACLKQERKDGKIVSPALTQKLFQQIENKTKFETEMILAQTFQHVPEQTQKIKPQQDGSVVLQITLTQEQFEIFKQAQNLLSHLVPDQSFSETITYLAKAYYKKVQGKGERISADKKRSVGGSPLTNLQEADYQSSKIVKSMDQSVTERNLTQGFVEKPLVVTSSPKKQNSRKYISVHLKRVLFGKSNYSCEFVHPETGKKCCSKYQLQIDHFDPLALGGSDDRRNLRVLCAVHNRAEAESFQLLL